MAITRRTALAAFAALALALHSGLAPATQPWNEKAFRDAQAAGHPVLVDIYADW